MAYSEEGKAAGRKAYKECRESGGTLSNARVAYVKAVRRLDPTDGRRRSLDWYYKNQSRAMEKGRLRYQKDPELERAKSRKRAAETRGYAPPDPDGPGLPELIAAQGGRCAVCAEPGKRLVLDHCHMTGKVRGALCGPCNRGLGMFRDRTEVLRLAVTYLETA